MQQSQYPLPGQLDSMDQPPAYKAPPPGYGQPTAPGYQPPTAPGYQQAPAQPVVFQPNIIVNQSTSQQQQQQQNVFVSVAKPSSYLCLAVTTCLLFNPFFGIVAIIFSVLSSTSADEGDIEAARVKGRISCGISLFGIGLAAILVIVAIAILASATATVYPPVYP